MSAWAQRVSGWALYKCSIIIVIIITHLAELKKYKQQLCKWNARRKHQQQANIVYDVICFIYNTIKMERCRHGRQSKALFHWEITSFLLYRKSLVHSSTFSCLDKSHISLICQTACSAFFSQHILSFDNDIDLLCNFRSTINSHEI